MINDQLFLSVYTSYVVFRSQSRCLYGCHMSQAAILGRLVPKQVRCTQGGSLPPQPTNEPQDFVNDEALARLQAAIADGSMRAEVDLWKLDRPEVVKELVLLASAPRRAMCCDCS